MYNYFNPQGYNLKRERTYAADNQSRKWRQESWSGGSKSISDALEDRGVLQIQEITIRIWGDESTFTQFDKESWYIAYDSNRIYMYDERIMVMELIEYSKRIYGANKFIFYAIADGILL